MIFDIETDGLNPTKIHCLSYKASRDGEVSSTTDYQEMRDLFHTEKVLIGHNIVRYDIPAVEKILGVTLGEDVQIIDTLALSWYLNVNRGKHGLESFGEDYGIPKPFIKDWENLSVEEYINRCEQDVMINERLYNTLMMKLGRLYRHDDDLKKCLGYLTFKMQCANEQEKVGWKLDVDKASLHYNQLLSLQESKVRQLAAAMPVRKIYATRNRPKKYYTKDGSLSTLGQKWEDLMSSMFLPPTTETVRVVVSEEQANPNSVTQVKEWLRSLNWQPITFEYNRDKKTGDVKAVEQIRKDGELCESVKDLIEVDPAVELLDGLTVINHRLGILKAFLSHEEGGYVKATIAGFTNTLRFRHAKPLVNLPSVEKPWGEEIRGCLTCPEGYNLCGADMTSLEDTTKRHYMQPHDPKYVEEMSKKGFDPHLDLAKHAGKVKQSDIEAHNSGAVDLKPLRKKFKAVNYSATYGVGATKLSRVLGIPEYEASLMLSAFWDRNWAIERVAKDARVREISGESWLLNPVSGMYHNLRYEKDKFSTLNQSTGVYCFDLWVKACREAGLVTIGQFHDEIIVLVKEGEERKTTVVMSDSIAKVNETANLNVPLGIDYSLGKSYAEVH